MLICAVVHQNAYGLYECFSVSDRCKDVSSFKFIVFILIHGDKTVPSVILGDSRNLTGRVPSWWNWYRLCRSCDLVHTVSFPLSLPFLPLLLGALPLLASLNQQSLAPCGQRVRIRSNSSLIPSVLLFPLFFAFAFLQQGIDLHIIWSSPVVGCHCHTHTCLVLCVVLQELHCFEGSQVLHLKWGLAHSWVLMEESSPEIDSPLRMFSCHSSSAISYAVSSKGKVFALRIALKTLYSRRCVWRVSHDQRSPCQCSVHVCDSSDHCQCWSSHFHH